MTTFNLTVSRWRFAVGCLLVLLTTTASALQPFTAEYTVKSGKKSLGTLSVELTRSEDNQYVLSATTNPGKLAKMLGSKTSTEVTRFLNTDSGWKLVEFKQIRRGRKAGETSVTLVDQRYQLALDNAVLHNIDGDTAIEPTTYPLATLTSLKSHLHNKDIMLVRPKGFRAHRYEFLGEEKISIEDTEYQTEKWQRTETKNPDRWYEFWIDSTTRQLIKLERIKKGRSSSLVLIPK